MTQNSQHNEKMWKWGECKNLLIHQINNKQVIWNLSPTIVLQNPDHNRPNPTVRILIDMEKSLNFSEDLGWNWHKSWNLPNISIRIDIRDEETYECFQSPKNLYAEVFAVKSRIINGSLTYKDVGLSGNSLIQIQDGNAYFVGLKFQSTSYNNEGSKFNLLVCNYIQGEDDSNPKIISSCISPDIFIDSRKQIRNLSIERQKKNHQYFKLFSPSIVDFVFFKIQKKDQISFKIENNLQGLYNYLSAPNIRNKTKHPLFLAMRFSECTSIYYNETKFENKSLYQILEILQNNLVNDNNFNQNDSFQSSNEQKFDTKLFILYVQDSDIQLILNQLEILKNSFIQVIYGNFQNVPPKFKQIDDMYQLQKQYEYLFKKSQNSSDFYKNLDTQSLVNFDSLSESEKHNIQFDVGNGKVEKKIKIDSDFKKQSVSNIVESKQDVIKEDQENLQLNQQINPIVPENNLEDAQQDQQSGSKQQINQYKKYIQTQTIQQQFQQNQQLQEQIKQQQQQQQYQLQQQLLQQKNTSDQQIPNANQTNVPYPNPTQYQQQMYMQQQQQQQQMMYMNQIIQNYQMQMNQTSNNRNLQQQNRQNQMPNQLNMPQNFNAQNTNMMNMNFNQVQPNYNTLNPQIYHMYQQQMMMSTQYYLQQQQMAQKFQQQQNQINNQNKQASNQKKQTQKQENQSKIDKNVIVKNEKDKEDNENNENKEDKEDKEHEKQIEELFIVQDQNKKQKDEFKNFEDIQLKQEILNENNVDQK